VRSSTKKDDSTFEKFHDFSKLQKWQRASRTFFTSIKRRPLAGNYLPFGTHACIVSLFSRVM
jgi:hypothetical protein